MASADDRRRAAYLDATTLSQTMLDETFRGGEIQIEAIGTLTKTVGATTYTLRFADRPKFVGDDWYEGRAQFPTVKRTLGDLQAAAIQFAQFEVVLDNMDGYYNHYLEGGADYINLTGARLLIQIGLRDVSGSLITVFDGFVPEEDGFDVSRESLTIRATDRFNALNNKSPLPYINDTDFPSAPQESIGKTIPMVLGDWEAGYTYKFKASKESVSDGVQPTPTNGEVWADAPNGFSGGVVGYYVGGGHFVFSIGNYTPDNIAVVHIKRGEKMLQCDFDATPVNTAGYWSVHINNLKTTAAGTFTYAYQSGDIAMIAVKVPYAVGHYSNIVELSREVLYTLGSRVSGDLDAASWAYFIAKSSPSYSDMTTLKARLWIGDDKETVLGLALGLLEQVRIEMFIDANGKIKLSSLHPEEFPAPAAASRIDQTDINEDRTATKAAENMFFNQAWLNYAFTPVTGKTTLSTAQYKNQTSIDKSGKQVIKVIDTPNLYLEADAINQLQELLRFYSAGLSFVEAEVCWAHLLRDLGGFVSFNFAIGALAFAEVPMMIRDIGINLSTGAVSLKLLSFANFAYASYSPSNASRFLSSASQSITTA